MQSAAIALLFVPALRFAGIDLARRREYGRVPGTDVRVVQMGLPALSQKQELAYERDRLSEDCTRLLRQVQPPPYHTRPHYCCLVYHELESSRTSRAAWYRAALEQ
eukprot:1571374-Rhodomonas_salina.2